MEKIIVNKKIYTRVRKKENKTILEAIHWLVIKMAKVEEIQTMMITCLAWRRFCFKNRRISKKIDHESLKKYSVYEWKRSNRYSSIISKNNELWKKYCSSYSTMILKHGIQNVFGFVLDCIRFRVCFPIFGNFISAPMFWKNNWYGVTFLYYVKLLPPAKLQLYFLKS